MPNNHHENVVANVDIGVRFFKSAVTTSGYVPFHWHNSIELVCVFQGKLVFNLNGQTYEIGPRQFMVVSSSVIHSVTNDPNVALVLQVPLPYLAAYCRHPEELVFMVEADQSAAYQRIVADFIQLDQLNHDQPAGYLFDFGATVLDLLKLVVTHFAHRGATTNELTSNLKELMVYINANYTTSLSTQRLADQFGYNPSYLSRMFKEQVGLTLTDYVYKVRLNNFYQDLLVTTIPIGTLFKKHGLTNVNMARTLFSQMYNCLPKQARQAYQRTHQTRP